MNLSRLADLAVLFVAGLLVGFWTFAWLRWCWRAAKRWRELRREVAGTWRYWRATAGLMLLDSVREDYGGGLSVTFVPEISAALPPVISVEPSREVLH
jgi:hypothetical protein